METFNAAVWMSLRIGIGITDEYQAELEPTATPLSRFRAFPSVLTGIRSNLARPSRARLSAAAPLCAERIAALHPLLPSSAARCAPYSLPPPAGQAALPLLPSAGDGKLDLGSVPAAMVMVDGSIQDKWLPELGKDRSRLDSILFPISAGRAAILFPIPISGRPCRHPLPHPHLRQAAPPSSCPSPADCTSVRASISSEPCCRPCPFSSMSRRPAPSTARDRARLRQRGSPVRSSLTFPISGRPICSTATLFLSMAGSKKG